MSTSFTKRTLFSGILIASSLSTMAYAEQPKSGITVTPSIGYYNTDDDRNIDNDISYSVGVGYQFNNPVAVEGTYLHTRGHTNGKDNNIDQYRIDGIYSLPEFDTVNLTPYLAAGFGNSDVGGSNASNNMLVDAGGGVKYAINQNVSLRADFRLVKDVQDNHLDNVSSVGVQYTFGLPKIAGIGS